MTIDFFDEPELEFGYGSHIDIRFGISNYSPFDVDDDLAPKKIKVGIVGTSQTIEEFCNWVAVCRNGIDARSSKKPKLFPQFPGFRNDSCFRSELILDGQLQKTIPSLEQTTLLKPSHRHDVISGAVAIFEQEVNTLAERKPDVIVCAPPKELVERMLAVAEKKKDEEEDEEAITSTTDNFRRMLKARAMASRVPLQIVLPHTYNERVRYDTELFKGRKVQDAATRAWNLFTALYYKANGTPWRLKPDPNEYTSCFVGISFYRTIDDETMQTSLAQIFNERGKGVILRGGKAEKNEHDLQPHLSKEDAYDLVKQALQRYWSEHKNLPARVVIHKTSIYSVDEMEGFEQAISERGISWVDMLTVLKSDLKLYRNGLYPPLRGTRMDLDQTTSLLYTRGSVQFYETYPGMYIPRALEIRLFKAHSTQSAICKEILALTKMNWNNTQFDGGLPITLKCARQVADIMKYVETDEIDHRYSFYM